MATLEEYAQSEIRKFLKLLNAQKKAKEQDLPRSERMKFVSAYALPPQYDPYVILPSHAIIEQPGPDQIKPSKWKPEEPLLKQNGDQRSFGLCSNVSLIDFSVGPLAEKEAGDWTR